MADDMTPLRLATTISQYLEPRDDIAWTKIGEGDPVSCIMLVCTQGGTIFSVDVNRDPVKTGEADASDG